MALVLLLVQAKLFKALLYSITELTKEIKVTAMCVCVCGGGWGGLQATLTSSMLVS